MTRTRVTDAVEALAEIRTDFPAAYAAAADTGFGAFERLWEDALGRPAPENFTSLLEQYDIRAYNRARAAGRRLEQALQAGDPGLLTREEEQ